MPYKPHLGVGRARLRARRSAAAPARRARTAGAAIVALASFALLAVVPAAPARTIVRILDDARLHASPGGAVLVDGGYVATEPVSYTHLTLPTKRIV